MCAAIIGFLSLWFPCSEGKGKFLKDVCLRSVSKCSCGLSNKYFWTPFTVFQFAFDILNLFNGQQPYMGPIIIHRFRIYLSEHSLPLYYYSGEIHSTGKACRRKCLNFLQAPFGLEGGIVFKTGLSRNETFRWAPELHCRHTATAYTACPHSPQYTGLQSPESCPINPPTGFEHFYVIPSFSESTTPLNCL